MHFCLDLQNYSFYKQRQNINLNLLKYELKFRFLKKYNINLYFKQLKIFHAIFEV